MWGVTVDVIRPAAAHWRPSQVVRHLAPGETRGNQGATRNQKLMDDESWFWERPNRKAKTDHCGQTIYYIGHRLGKLITQALLLLLPVA